MCDPIKHFGQPEYTRVLMNHNASGLSHARCMSILTDHGADSEQAKNGAYQFLHHRESLVTRRSGTQDEYDRILDRFGARQKRPMDCIQHLEQQGYSFNQAKTAIHRYRSKRGLIR
ncbi:MAG: hypothetical protein HOH43_28090 [Candidatus Latescibacteria bacterium]|jgi:hypothetical protein|nr:hypothetical protein [Candidatus Latescibacterota bacterium]